LARVAESVSGLENWLECPRLWFFTRRLGLDTASLGHGAGQSGQASGVSHSAELGSLVHGLLELADLGQGPAGLEAVLAEEARELGAEEGLAREALALAKGLWDTPVPGWLADVTPGQLRREEPFHLFLGGGGAGPGVELIGEFDLLAPLAKGGWLVCDYKVSAKVEPEKYRAQMALYALALWQGQGCLGPLPRLALCYLTPTGGRLVELAFSAEELSHWRERVLSAGRAMAALAPGVRALDLPAGERCRREGCALGRADLCPG
jgi:ATP-dependent helicase/nuclease subunit A